MELFKIMNNNTRVHFWSNTEPPVAKWPGYKANHSPASGAEVKIVWIYSR
jgi:hypothetical protein